MDNAQPRIVVLGIGNVLWADEGFGVRAVQGLHEQWQVPESVELVDGGTQGLALLPWVEWADKLIIFDAVDFGLPLGALCQKEGKDVPACLVARKMSLHQTGFSDVLACAQLRDCYPQEVVLIGVQPVQLEDYGGSLCPSVKAQLGPAIALACNVLQRWEVALQVRTTPAQSLSAASIAMARYESERPDAQTANRLGDPRFWQPKVTN